MQYSKRISVCILGLCLIIGQTLGAPNEKIDLPDLPTLCDVLEKIHFQPVINLGSVNLTSPPVGSTWLSFTAEEISILGLDGLTFTECNNETLSGSLPEATLYITGYTLGGLIMNHLHISGGGNASIMMEDFTMILTGEVTEEGTLTNLYLDLSMHQWTVIIENLMPGTDMGVLINEFMSGLGPEVANAIEDALNEGLGFTNYMNELISGKKHRDVQYI